MINDFFKRIIHASSCGNKGNGETTIIGILDENPFSAEMNPLSNEEASDIISTAYQESNNITEILSSKETANAIKETKKLILLYNHNYTDALVFNQHLPLNKAAVESILHALDTMNTGIDKTNAQEEIGKLSDKEITRLTADNSHRIHHLKNLSLANLSRLGTLDGYEKHAKKEYDLSQNDLAIFIFRHELAHGCFHIKGNNSSQNKKENETEKEKAIRLRKMNIETMKAEGLADAYAVISHIAATGKTNLAEYVADMRAIDAYLEKDTEQISFEIKDTKQTLMLNRYLDHYTTPIMEGIIEEYKKNPELFTKVKGNHRAIMDLTEKLCEKYSLEYDVENEESDKKLSTKLYDRAQKALKILGMISKGTSSIICCESLSPKEKVKPISLSEKIAEPKKIKKGLTVKTQERIGNGEDYKRAFLHAYAEMTAEALTTYDVDKKSQTDYKILTKLLQNSQEIEKQVKTPENILRFIASKAEPIQNPPDDMIIGNYCKTKTEYASRILEVVKDIKHGNINTETAEKFKEAVILAKQAKQLATLASDKGIVPEEKQLKKAIAADVKEEYPAELIRLVMTRNPTLQQRRKLKQQTR